MPQSNPQPGEVYRHFKGKMYKVQSIAIHSETGEALVIYQGLYGDNIIYARPYESFIDAIDPAKYPGVVEKYRFTHIPMGGDVSPAPVASVSVNAAPVSAEPVGTTAPIASTPVAATTTNTVTDVNEDSDVNVDSPMIRFLDTEDFDKKYEILCDIPESEITDILIDNLAVTLDVVIPDGPTEQRFAELKTCVRTRKKYESLRLR